MSTDPRPSATQYDFHPSADEALYVHSEGSTIHVLHDEDGNSRSDLTVAPPGEGIYGEEAILEAYRSGLCQGWSDRGLYRD